MISSTFLVSVAFTSSLIFVISLFLIFLGLIWSLLSRNIILSFFMRYELSSSLTKALTTVKDSPLEQFINPLSFDMVCF